MQMSYPAYSKFMPLQALSFRSGSNKADTDRAGAPYMTALPSRVGSSCKVTREWDLSTETDPAHCFAMYGAPNAVGFQHVLQFHRGSRVISTNCSGARSPPLAVACTST